MACSSSSVVQHGMFKMKIAIHYGKEIRTETISYCNSHSSKEPLKMHENTSSPRDPHS